MKLKNKKIFFYRTISNFNSTTRGFVILRTRTLKTTKVLMSLSSMGKRKSSVMRVRDTLSFSIKNNRIYVNYSEFGKKEKRLIHGKKFEFYRPEQRVAAFRKELDALLDSVKI